MEKLRSTNSTTITNMKDYVICQDYSHLYGLVDSTNNTTKLPFIFEEIKIIGELVCLKRNGKWGILPVKELEIKSINKEEVSKITTHVPKYLFFDTETTGVPKDYKAPAANLDNWPRLVQLGWILTDAKGNEIASGNDLIKPNGFVIPVEASRVHRITTDIAYSKGIDLTNSLQKFMEAAKKAECIAGHNISFDIKVVEAELIRTHIGCSIESKPSICTMLQSIQYCAIPSDRLYGDKYKWPKLQELHKKLFGYEFEDAHDAMADIRATKKCFFAMKERGLIK